MLDDDDDCSSESTKFTIPDDVAPSDLSLSMTTTPTPTNSRRPSVSESSTFLFTIEQELTGKARLGKDPPFYVFWTLTRLISIQI